MLHVNSTAASSIEPDLLLIEVLYCGNRDFRVFCSCNLDLDPMIFIYKLHMHPIKNTGGSKLNFLRQRFRKLYIQYTQLPKTVPRCFACGNKYLIFTA